MTQQIFSSLTIGLQFSDTKNKEAKRLFSRSSQGKNILEERVKILDYLLLSIYIFIYTFTKISQKV